MFEAYDKITAKHYAAFRPPLHSPILSKCIDGDEQWRSGLDVGCGTGRSTVALAQFCDSVIGIDPSAEMLKSAIRHPKIEYQKGFLEESDMDSSSCDIITFAGVLFYSKSEKLYGEVVRVGKPDSKIIIYDFEVVMKDVFEILDLPANTSSETTYDHTMNFSGYHDGRLTEKTVMKDKVDLSISPSDLTHLVLSEKSAYEKLKLKLAVKNIFENVRDVLRNRSDGQNLEVETNIFYSVYENTKSY